jgi:hypothetical protein
MSQGDLERERRRDEGNGYGGAGLEDEAAIRKDAGHVVLPEEYDVVAW